LVSAKQRAARAKFSRIMKSGGFGKRKTKSAKKTIVKRTKSARVKRKSSPIKNKNMARRKTRFSRVRRAGSRISKGRNKITNLLTHGIVGKTTSALGAGIVVGSLADRTVPQVSVYASLGAEYLAGGVTGMVLAEGVKSFIGMPSILGQVFSSFGIGGIGPSGNAELTV